MEVTLLPVNEQEVISKLYIACRTCYNAGTPNDMYKDMVATPMTVENTEKKLKLLKHVIDSGHHCYDEDTEVLTNHGFKRWADLDDTDKLGTFDPNTRKLVAFETPLELISDDYNGEMFLYDFRNVSLMVTPGHRLFCSLSNTEENRVTPKFEFHKANELIIDKSYKNKVVAEKPMRFCSSSGSDMNITYNPLNIPENKIIPFLKLLGFFIGDGYSSGGNNMRFHLRLERKIQYLRKLADELDFEYRECKSDKYVIFYSNLGKWACSNLYDINKEKHIPEELLSCSEEHIRAFIDGLINSDGSINKRGIICYDSTSTQVISMVQSLYALIGVRTSSVCKQSNKEEQKNVYRVYHKSRMNMPHVNDSRNQKGHVQRVSYTGKVYCARVSTGLLLVRRHGSVLLSGNSVLEHQQLTFLISGVSRALSHQLVRHRLANISQQSQRYCEFKDGIFEYVTPQKIFNNKDANKLFLQTMITLSEAYDNLIKLGIPAEDARAVLPNACTTNLTWSVNIRELMHTCSERRCSCAQHEIRQLFNMIANETIRQLPFLKPYLGPKCDMLGYCNESKQRSCGRKYTKDVVFGSLEVHN